MRTDELYLRDITDACDSIEQFISDVSKAEFFDSDLILSAVTRKLEIIGEACARLPAPLREKYVEVDWKAIIGFRNILAHQYFSCDLEIVWESASKDVKVLKNQILAIARAEFPRDNS